MESKRTNLLQIQWNTVENVMLVIKEILTQNGIPYSEYTKEIKDKDVIISLLGKRISIPLYNKNLGQLVNAKELKENPLSSKVYDNVEYTSLSKDEIKSIIMKSFEVEDNIESAE